MDQEKITSPTDNFFYDELRITKDRGFFGVTLPVGYTDFVHGVPAGTLSTPIFFVAQRPYKIMEIRERHSAANVGALSVQIKKVPSGTSVANGTSVLVTGFNLTSTANTNKLGVVNRNKAQGNNYDTLLENDCLALVYTGTPLAVRDMHVSVLLRSI